MSLHFVSEGACERFRTHRRNATDPHKRCSRGQDEPSNVNNPTQEAYFGQAAAKVSAALEKSEKDRFNDYDLNRTPCNQNCVYPPTTRLCLRKFKIGTKATIVDLKFGEPIYEKPTSDADRHQAEHRSKKQ